MSGSYELHNQTTASTRQAIATDDPVQLLDKLADNASKGAAQIKKVADAAKPLYDSLDPAQGRAFGAAASHSQHESDGSCDAGAARVSFWCNGGLVYNL